MRRTVRSQFDQFGFYSGTFDTLPGIGVLRTVLILVLVFPNGMNGSDVNKDWSHKDKDKGKDFTSYNLQGLTE